MHLLFINCGTQWIPLKLIVHALCLPTLFFHLENCSVSCLSHLPGMSICCRSFKTQFKSHFLKGSSFDHLSWKEPYLSLNCQRITYGSYHSLLCITAMPFIFQRWDLMFWNWICFILCFLHDALHNVFWMNERVKWPKTYLFVYLLVLFMLVPRNRSSNCDSKI